MGHIKITFTVSQQDETDQLIALLDDEGYLGFEENDNNLCAFIEEDNYDEARLNEIIGDTEFSKEHIPVQNWNEIWENSFEPIVIEGICTIRADFHHIPITTKYELVITPKMSFGTGHHETTRLMILQMGNMDLTDKKVLDFGTGTGILAIFASKCGASTVYAIDNDQWCIENAIENVVQNGCSDIEVGLGGLEVANGQRYDVILANINRNVLIDSCSAISELLNENGLVLLSGILLKDEDDIKNTFIQYGFEVLKTIIENNWMSVLFRKD